MAETVNVYGAAAIKVDTGAANALELLGYSRNAPDISFNDFFSDVPGDQNGGDEGPPIEIEYFADTATVRMELTKWDLAIMDKVTQRLRTNVTRGTPAAVGGLMFASSFTYRLLLHTTSNAYNFLRAFPRRAMEINPGTKWSTFRMEWECHKNASGVLYNATTT